MEFKGLEKIKIEKAWITLYRKKHKSRAFEKRLRGGLMKPRHPHMNNPYCSICDEDLQVSDTCYILYVGGHPVPYHVSCITSKRNSEKVKNILAQDRSYREKKEKERQEIKKIRVQLYEYMIEQLVSDQQ